MSTEETTFCIVFETHWDREWIQSFDQYRFRLVNLIDNLLDILAAEPEISFMFDGQTVVIEDYLAVRPERKADLLAFAKAHRIVFGPWYVLADQFLEGEEATIRNLQIGFATADEYGGAMRHGYVPDSFGSTATLPAILSGFGIKYASLHHGACHLKDMSKRFFRWQSPDGSAVLAVRAGYADAVPLAYPDIWRNIEEIVPDIECATTHAERLINLWHENRQGPFVYAPCGIDHMEMRPGMSKIVDQLSQRIPDATFNITDTATFMNEVGQWLCAHDAILETVVGEMRGDAQTPMMNLHGCLSTNAKIKQENRKCEIELSRVLEPLDAVHHALRIKSMRHFITYAWKTLIKNHPHDSICACSRDNVIGEMLERNRAVHEIADLMTERIMHELLPPPAHSNAMTPAITLFNSMTHRGVSPFKATIRVPSRINANTLAMVTKEGATVGTARRVAIKNIDLESYYAANRDLLVLISKEAPVDRDDRQCYTIFDVTGVDDFGDNAGFRTYRLIEEPSEHKSEVGHSDRTLWNSRVKIEIAENGSVTLTDLVTSVTYPNLGWYEDRAECGNSYETVPLPGDVAITTLSGQAVVVPGPCDDESASLVVETTLAIPEGLIEDRRSANCFTHRLSTTYTLHAGSSRVDVSVSVDNRSVAHQLRAGFSFESRPAAMTGGNFSALNRDWIPDTHDAYPVALPMLDYIYFDEGARKGLTLMTRGIYACDLRADHEGGNAYLTLVRSVDAIGSLAGSNYPIEHAKMLGPCQFEFAIAPAKSIASAIHQAAAYVTPVIAEGGLSAEREDLPEAVVGFDTDRVALTCFKQAQDGNGYIVRFYNPHADNVPVVLQFGLPFQSVHLVDLSETSATHQNVERVGAESVRLIAAPHAIVTLRFE